MKGMIFIRGKYIIICLAALFMIGLSTLASGQKKKDKESDQITDTIKSGELSGLKLRSIGPAFTSGRIADFVLALVGHR